MALPVQVATYLLVYQHRAQIEMSARNLRSVLEKDSQAMIYACSSRLNRLLCA